MLADFQICISVPLINRGVTDFITKIVKKVRPIEQHFEAGNFRHRRLQHQWFLFLLTEEWLDIYILHQSYY